MSYSSLVESLRGGLIVSCQALPDEPLYGSHHMAAMARAAAIGGAIGIRANGPADIAACRAAVELPIIGLFKEDIPGFAVRITPTIKHAEQIAQAGSDVIAMDATRRARPDGCSVKTMIAHIHERIGKPVLADVSTLEEGLSCRRGGSGFCRYHPLRLYTL